MKSAKTNLITTLIKSWGCRVLLTFVVISSTTSRVTAQEIVLPQSVGLSKERLESVTGFLRSEVAKGRIAGAVGLIARHGQVAYLEAIGNADLETQTPMPTDALFRIASMSKAITSVAVMMLVEDGKLELSGSVSDVLPEFAEVEVLAGTAADPENTVPVERAITIHDLLTHTSGVTYGWSGPAEFDALYKKANVGDTFLPVDETMGDRVARLGRLPLKFQPGSAWDYGLSLDVLGRVVEVVSGLRLDQFLHERIFRPLGLSDTSFFVPDDQRARLASLYTLGDNDGLLRVDQEPVTADLLTFSGDYCYAGERQFFSGGGGLVSTARDYARFLQMLLGEGALGDVRILGRQTVALMTRNQIGALPITAMGHGDAFGYGFGVLTERGSADDPASVGTYSWGGIFNTFYWVDPQEQMVGVLMTQIFPFGHLATRSEFKRLAYEALDDSGFARLYWYEKGTVNGNPFFDGHQLRVNAPETSIHPRYSKRSEPRSSGLARILIDEDLLAIRRATLCCEVWGGHPGTANKRVSVNGRNLYSFPEIGSAAGHCTHQYPEFTLEASDLVRGYNSFQFACDKGEASWGHYIVENACLKIGLSTEDPRIAEKDLSSFAPRVEVTPVPGDDSIRLRVIASPGDLAKISAVHFQGRYLGYDENGDTRSSDWHGMTKNRRSYGMIGHSSTSPFDVSWDTSFLVAQKRIAVRALVYLRGHDELVYATPISGGLEIPKREAIGVSSYRVRDIQSRFWSRAGRKKHCVIDLDVDPAKIEAAELHVVAWTGGAGTVSEYFTLNGQHFPVAEGHGHEVRYSRLMVEPSLLRKGINRVELLSDTEHHGIEILYPGPALVIRRRLD